jgi:spermidine synthase
MAGTIALEDIPTEYGTISITKNTDTGALTYAVGGRRQGAADSGGTSLAYYIHAIFGLLTQAKARNILMIGGACCTLATMLERARRQATIVDINPACFALARRYFGLAESVPCHAAEGEAFLRGQTSRYDAVVLDAFHGDDIPPHLHSPEFFALVRQCLTPGGAMFANVLVKHDFDDCPDRLAQSMKRVWPDVRVLDGAGVDHNAIVMAGQVLNLREPGLLQKPRIHAAAIRHELARLQFRAWKNAPRDFGGGSESR